MSDYKFMSLSTSFDRTIEGKQHTFIINVDCMGNVKVIPMLPDRLERDFPNGVVLEIINGTLNIYPKNPH